MGEGCWYGFLSGGEVWQWLVVVVGVGEVCRIG